MEVFVLIGHINYEDSCVLGVYHTMQDAIYSRDMFWAEKGDDAFDCYSFERRVIGASAESNYSGKYDSVEVK